MTVTEIMTPISRGMLHISGKHSSRVPAIAPREDVFSLPSPPGSAPLSATKLVVPPRIRLPPRSRTGCWTCRSRKVKCDENRPNCSQCARLGHLCDYSPRLSFRDDTPRVMERVSEVSTAGNAVWDPSIRVHSPPVSPGLYDSMPPFFTLTSDEEREKKAENSYPGTYHVVVVPDSFSSLPEYSDECSIDLNAMSLKGRRGSATSSLLSPRDDRESSIETNDPNVVILDRFQDSSQRYSVTQWKKTRLSPASSVVTSPPTSTSSLHFPFDSHLALSRALGVEHGSQDEQLLVHFRNVVWKQLIPGQSSQEIFSPLSSPIIPGAEIFEEVASAFPPLLHAMMAVSALSLARQQGSQSLDALQHYQQAFPSLQTALRNNEDLCSDGLFLTHFLLLIYEIAAAEEGGSNLWSHHMSQLLQISIMRVSTFGSERYPYIIWLLCNIDLYALLSGAGTGDFLKAMFKNNMLPNPKCQLYPLATTGYSIVYQDSTTLPSVLQLYHDTFVLASRLAVLAADLRRQGVCYDSSLDSNSPTVENTKWLYETRDHFQQLWGSPEAHYLCQHVDTLPQRSRELLQNAMTLYHSCMIYSYTSMWRGQRLGPDGACEEVISHHASVILQVAETIVRAERLDLRFVIFPLFMAGVSTSSAGQKMMAIDLVSSMEKQGVGRNATTTRELLQLVYQSQTEHLMTVGHSANVEWRDVMTQHGLQVVNFGIASVNHDSSSSVAFAAGKLVDFLPSPNHSPQRPANRCGLVDKGQLLAHLIRIDLKGVTCFIQPDRTFAHKPHTVYRLDSPANRVELAMSPTNSNHRGKPEEEMFLTSPAAGGRRQNESEPPFVEPLRISKPPSAAPTPQPTTTLPYPDDRPRPQHAESPSSQPPYPETGRISSPAQRVASPSSAPSTSDYPATLRPHEPRENKPSLAERRGNAPPKPLPESPVADIPDKERLYQRLPPGPVPTANRPAAAETNDQEYNQQYFPPPPSGNTAQNSSTAAQARLRASNPNSINRISSTASNSTTRAQRGSPPPPETPIVGPGQQPGADIEARFAAAGIAGTSTLASLQSHNAAAQQRANQYANQRPTQRPWTPTEQPGTQPHGPPTVYQGSNEIGNQQNLLPVSSQPTAQSPATSNSSDRPVIPPNALEQDFQRMQLTSSPPPAYSSVPGANASQSYPNEKPRPGGAAAPPQGHPASSVAPSTSGSAIGAAAAIAPVNSPAPSVQSHPAFANDPRQQQLNSSPQQNYQTGAPPEQQAQVSASPAPGGIPPASPPPLPEGWIAHLDPNSGQYYYIHLPTQSTQWEFPKGPTPLNLNETPLSPVGSVYSAHPLTSPAFSTFGGKPLASPGIPMTPMYEGSVMGFSTAGAVSGPPPTSGVELYKVAATNGVYFGPYLRYCNMDLERGIWLGSILLVTDAPQPPTIHIHQSVDLSPNPRQLKAVNIHQHQRWIFYKYDIDLQMDESGPAKWTYAITSHLGCTRYEFLVAGRYETNWRFIATSGNDFALNVNANERARLGGVGFMWKDIMQKHAEVGGFHCQLGLGGQIFADRIWKEIPLLRQWLGIHGKEQRKNAPWTASHEEEVSHAYFHFYTSHFDQPHLREAFAQIPYILQVDDHDIFDGFGSYPQHMQFSNMFKNIGRIGIETYLLFQHHTTLELLRNVSTDHDLFTITGTGWHFVKYLGPAVVVVGPDCRSERNPHQVMAGPTYQGLFPKIALLPPSVQHCIWMISVPLIYPRLESTEQIANAMATGKKAVTGAYNLLGKVTSSVAGVVGAKDAVGSGFEAVKRAVGKTGLMGSVLNPFGEIDILDELRDQWTHDSKDLERTYLIRTLQGIAKQKSIRMTFLSGAVNVCGAGLVHDPSHPSDHKTMYQLIASPVVNTPPSSYILKLLHNNKPLYIPANGQRSTPSQPTDTKEDMLELFQTDVTGQPREFRRLMGRRNYVAIVAYDPEVVSGTFGQTDMQRGGGKLSLAADFMVQGEGAYGNVVKYGPVIVPSLEYGR